MTASFLTIMLKTFEAKANNWWFYYGLIKEKTCISNRLLSFQKEEISFFTFLEKRIFEVKVTYHNVSSILAQCLISRFLDVFRG